MDAGALSPAEAKSGARKKEKIQGPTSEACGFLTGHLTTLFVNFFFNQSGSRYAGWPRTHYVDQASPELSCLALEAGINDACCWTAPPPQTQVPEGAKDVHFLYSKV